MVGYHHNKYCTESISQDMGERKGNASIPSLMSGENSTQPSSSRDPTNSPGVGWLGTVVARVQGGEGEEREKQMVCGLGREVDIERLGKQGTG